MSNNKSIDNILRDVLYAISPVYGESGQSLRKMADDLYGRPHVLLTPATCNLSHDDRQCPVCDGGLAVCANCNEFEAGLDNPCKSQSQQDGCPRCGSNLEKAETERGVVYTCQNCAFRARNQRELIGIHDSLTCALGVNGGPCNQCRWATNTERAPFPEQATYNFGGAAARSSLTFSKGTNNK